MCVSLTSTSVGQVLYGELGGLLLVITLTWRWIFGPERKSVDPKCGGVFCLCACLLKQNSY